MKTNKTEEIENAIDALTPIAIYLETSAKQLKKEIKKLREKKKALENKR